MLGNITTGDEFGELADYLKSGTKGRNVDKKAELLGSAGVRTDTLAHTIADFNLGRQLHPELGKAVLHISLSFNPSDEAKMSNARMREIAEEYMQKMGMGGTQYLLIRHRDRPHEHLHIMANRVADDGHTISDSNSFRNSRDVLVELVNKYDLTPLDGQRPHLQHPERLRGNDLVRHELRQALREAKATETERPRLLATLVEQGITAREFVDKSGTVTGISFRKDNCAFKGSALGPEFTLPAIERQLVANRQAQLVAVVLVPPVVSVEGVAIEAAPGRSPAVTEPVGERLGVVAPPSKLPTRVPEEPAAGAVKTMIMVPVVEPVHPVTVGLVQPIVAASSAAPAKEATAQVPPSILLLANQPAPQAAETGGALPATRPVIVAAVAEVSAAAAGPPVPAKLVSAALAPAAAARVPGGREQKPEDPMQPPGGDKEATRYENLRAAVTKKITLADQQVYQSVPEFLALLPAQQLALLPATAARPAQVVDQQSGQGFPAETVLLGGRPFLEHVQAKATRTAEAAQVPTPVDWAPRYRAYEQERKAAQAHNEAVDRVNYLVESSPNTKGVAAALALAQAPATPILADRQHIVKSLQLDLARQQQYEDDLRGVARRRAWLQETAKGKFGMGLGKAATEARAELDSQWVPSQPSWQAGVLRYQQPQPPPLTLPQFVAQRQPGLDDLRRQVLAVLAAENFTQWGEFKTTLHYHGVETKVTPEKQVEFYHKASGQSYQAAEVLPSFRDRYYQAEARGNTRKATQAPQRDLGISKASDGYTM